MSAGSKASGGTVFILASTVAVLICQRTADAPVINKMKVNLIAMFERWWITTLFIAKPAMQRKLSSGLSFYSLLPCPAETSAHKILVWCIRPE